MRELSTKVNKFKFMSLYNKLLFTTELIHHHKHTIYFYQPLWFRNFKVLRNHHTARNYLAISVKHSKHYYHLMETYPDILWAVLSQVSFPLWQIKD